MTTTPDLTEAETSAVIEMALSDHIAFAEIEAQFGLSDKQVKVLMRSNLKPSSYRTWRKRVREFSDRREHYK
ncbi:TIGR03643 family protein [Erythrobacter sp. MTPC3]|uniref:TIGR03643 family protein n=1 Tax=Erythrobacter sp. MTPC3 TaxID=3056564 RepID=UPI0036F22FEC